MRPIEATHRHGGNDGRLLIMGIAPRKTILALVAPPSSKLAISLLKGPLIGAEKAGVFYVLNIVVDDEDHRLFDALRQVIALGWQPGQKLTSKGDVVPYRNQNAGGYTLEALLGILPNGLPGPDMLGWEVKGHGGDRITLMTPEPDGGMYVHNGLRAFLERYGRKSDKDTLYFTGSHRYRVRSNLTGLTLRIAGYAPERGKIESPDGAIQLVDDNDTVTASWSFARLIELWAKKHSKAVFISFTKRQAPDGSPEFRFSPTIQTGRGTDFLLFLRSFAHLSVFYDPGCRIRGFESPKPEQKKRNQFRISASALSDLYHSFENLEL
ncbi:MAG: hypothetical protein GVY36_17525 [Verrucomicrobia bacterium]|nr:hypothetical protein [Verrucomicrobiota bacterium]